jgi:hypothetical protein
MIGFQNRRIEDGGGFTEGAHRGGFHAAQLLDFFEGGELLESLEAGDRGIEEIQEQERGVLIEEEVAVAGLVALGSVVVKPDEEVVDEAELFEPLKRLGDERLLFRARHARGCRRRRMMRKKRAERYCLIRLGEGLLEREREVSALTPGLA